MALAGEIVGVPSSYVMEADGSIGIHLGSYDASQALVVDPTILFTGYLSGTSADVPIGIGHDKNGLIYLAGYSYSPDFPTVGTAYTGFFVNTDQQAFTTVMSPAGSERQFHHLLGILHRQFRRLPQSHDGG